MAAASEKETGLPVTVEVATAKQVEDALHFDVDVLWIGARSTVNPFSIQEMADALRGVDVPVLIKNQSILILNFGLEPLKGLQKQGLKKSV
nr:hypothetical protein [Candidatus Brachybacter algidus]